MVKLYLFGPENNDPNDTPRTKHDDEKNGHKEDHKSTLGSIAIDSILVVMVTPPVAVNLPINSPNDYDC